MIEGLVDWDVALNCNHHLNKVEKAVKRLIPNHDKGSNDRKGSGHNDISAMHLLSLYSVD